MMELLAAVGSAFWLGLLTSISPCPLASNLAAIAYVGRDIGSSRRVVAAGLAYSIGRALSYVAVGALVVSSVLAIPKVSLFLQNRLSQVLGPLLVVIGVGLLTWSRLRLPTWNLGDAAGRRVAGRGLLGALALGALFALSFCPVSAGLFFGALVPLAIQADSRLLLPTVYGLGTGLPVLVCAIVLSLGAQGVGRTFHVLTRIEKYARPATGIVFILAGLYLTLRHHFELLA